MNDRQKLAALLLRIIGAGWSLIISVSIAMWLIESWLKIPVKEFPMHQIIGNVVYVVSGILLVLYSKPLGRILGTDLD